MFEMPKQKCATGVSALAFEHLQDGRGIGPIARDLWLVERRLRYWAATAKKGKLDPSDGKGVTPGEMCWRKHASWTPRMALRIAIPVNAANRRLTPSAGNTCDL